MKNFIFLLFIVASSSLYAQIINFPDANFKAKLLSAESGNGIAYLCNGNSFKIDSNENGEIEVAEALLVCNLAISNSNISNLTGIEYFNNLEHLQCNNNFLTELDLTPLTNLVGFDINNNQITSVDVTGLSHVNNLSFRDNQLTSINLSGLTSLRVLDIRNNQITSLSLDETQELNYLYCQNNNLTSINVNSLEALGYLDCSYNNLITLNAKNDSVESINFSNNENLQYICVDGEQLLEIEDKIIEYGYANCYANSLCTFNQGEVFYELLGNVKYDEDNDGCGSLDINYDGLMFTVSDNVNSGEMFSNSSGDYQFNAQEGSYVVSPVLSNTNYFNISPANVSITFPDDGSSVTQDFCITPMGSFPDLKISVMTIDSDYDHTATFRINYSNQGTVTQSGFVSFNFDDNIIDFNSANPTVSEQNTSELIWQFTELKPFETRSIDVVLYFNAPPISEGDVLSFSATIGSDLTEITPADNVYNFDHTFYCCLLSIDSFEFSDYFSQYPNPADDILNIKMEKQIDVKSILIYNLFGQQVKKMEYENNLVKIDVSDLESGHYFVRILTPKQEFTSRFIRK